jgi:hypothetical protein
MTILSIDLSTTCTGWALFNTNGRILIDYGTIRGKTQKGLSKWNTTLNKMKIMAEEIHELIRLYEPDKIVIEEITGSKNRMGQKTLDMMHGILWITIEHDLQKVEYYDVTGNKGWRVHLNLRLDDADKLSNKEARKLNKTLPSKQQIPIIGPKHLAARHANATFNLDLNVDLRKTDADMADAICIGDAFLKYRCTEL